MISEKKIYQALEEVLDPELGISIVDLGLIYQLQATSGKKGTRVKILMTLTAPGCPFMASLADEVKEKVASYRDWETDRKSTRRNSSHITRSRMPAVA